MIRFGWPVPYVSDREPPKQPSFERTMTFTELLLLLFIAGLCGSAGQGIAGYSRGGCLASIGVGFVGALLGTWIARMANFPEFFAVDVGDTTFPIVWAVLGATLFVAVIAMITGGRRE